MVYFHNFCVVTNLFMFSFRNCGMKMFSYVFIFFELMFWVSHNSSKHIVFSPQFCTLHREAAAACWCLTHKALKSWQALSPVALQRKDWSLLETTITTTTWHSGYCYVDLRKHRILDLISCSIWSPPRYKEWPHIHEQGGHTYLPLPMWQRRLHLNLPPWLTKKKKRKEISILTLKCEKWEKLHTHTHMKVIPRKWKW